MSDCNCLARERIDRQYDSAYARSSRAYYAQVPQATRLDVPPNDAAVVERARALLAAPE